MRKIGRISGKDILDKNSDAYVVEDVVFSELTRIPKSTLLDFPHIFEGFLLAFCSAGKARFKIDLREYSIEKDMLLIIFPNQIFEPISRSEFLHIQYLFFPLDILSGISFPFDLNVAFKIGKQPSIKVPTGIMQELQTYYNMIKNLHQRDTQVYRKEIVRGLLYSAVIQACSIYTDTESDLEIKSPHKERLIKNFLKLLMQNRKQVRNVSFYADQLFVTPKYLSSTLKKVTDRTALDWINEAVIIEAKTKLKTTDLTVMQISEELNFSNPSFFGRYFRQYTGMTPLEYRDR
ncbi:AraC family transcriptional regulator [Dysgonomonas macrotermitis]|uniref:Transcriptional regulator, AraC family n=1 Tax=Dysgonomonas macrotermitis TaxID=1346286 RepID=A0A1M4STD8_9BACT|nr:helix-turn-helix transcriptional regulator [Dysgonomonas macrotermitis]SHE35412.1 transcriptional regulator, AraC family [Dysgonomonas macrotermitis]